MTDERKEEIRDRLLKDGINFTLVMNMSNSELETADSIEDYDDYNDYLNSLCGQYNL